MREAKTINDVRELLDDHSVIAVLDGDKVYLIMKPTGDWEPSESELGQQHVRRRGEYPSDPEAIQFAAKAHNTIISLVFNPQFWRVTTVADQMTRFYGHDGGSMPAMFMRGKGRQPSREWRMTGMTKRSGEPFTIHFESESSAEKFISAATKGKFHRVRYSIEPSSQTE
jgi:hypothetical protein